MANLEWYFSGIDQNSQVVWTSSGIESEQALNARKSAEIICNMYGSDNCPDKVIECFFDKNMYITTGRPLAVHFAKTLIVSNCCVKPNVNPVGIIKYIEEENPQNDSPVIVDIETGVSSDVDIEKLLTTPEINETLKKLIMHKRYCPDVPFVAMIPENIEMLSLIQVMYFLLPVADRKKGFLSLYCTTRKETRERRVMTQKRYDFFFVNTSDNIPVVNRRGQAFTYLQNAEDELSCDKRKTSCDKCKIFDLESKALRALLSNGDFEGKWQILKCIGNYEIPLEEIGEKVFVKGLIENAIQCGKVEIARDILHSDEKNLASDIIDTLISLDKLIDAIPKCKCTKENTQLIFTFIKESVTGNQFAIPWLNRLLFRVSDENDKEEIYSIVNLSCGSNKCQNGQGSC